MPLEKLSAQQLMGRPKGRARRDYVDFLRSLRPGEGGRTTTETERATKQTIKNRLKRASELTGIKVKFLRSKPNEVLFQVAGR